MFDQQALASLGITFSDAEPFDGKKVREYLTTFDFSKVIHDEGISIVTIPKGLNLTKIFSLASQPRAGYLKAEIDDRRVPNRYQVEKTYRIIISNNILKDSYYPKSYDNPPDYYALLQQNAKALGGDLPTSLQAATFMILTFMNSNNTSSEFGFPSSRTKFGYQHSHTVIRENTIGDVVVVLSANYYEKYGFKIGHNLAYDTSQGGFVKEIA